jgi:hypothetical protein
VTLDFHRSVGFYAEAHQETVVTTREDMLVSNYIKKIGRSQKPDEEETAAYARRLEELEGSRTHRRDCFCGPCMEKGR